MNAIVLINVVVAVLLEKMVLLTCFGCLPVMYFTPENPPGKQLISEL